MAAKSAHCSALGRRRASRRICCAASPCRLQFATGAVGTIVAGYRDGQTRTSEWMELGGTAGSMVVEDITRRVILSDSRSRSTRDIFQPNPFGGRRCVLRFARRARASVSRTRRRRSAGRRSPATTAWPAWNWPRRPSSRWKPKAIVEVRASMTTSRRHHRFEPSACPNRRRHSPATLRRGSRFSIRPRRHRRPASDISTAATWHGRALRHAHGRAVSFFCRAARRSIAWRSSAAWGRPLLVQLPWEEHGPTIEPAHLAPHVERMADTTRVVFNTALASPLGSGRLFYRSSGHHRRRRAATGRLRRACWWASTRLASTVRRSTRTWPCWARAC